jgi:hypothetical protein
MRQWHCGKVATLMNSNASQSSRPKQSLHRDCLGVLITLVDWPHEQSEHIEVKGGVYGKKLAAVRFNTWAGKAARPTTYDVPPEGKAWLFASEWAGLFYAVQRDSYFGRLACTCEQPGCEHIKTVRGLISSKPSIINTNRRTYEPRSSTNHHRRSHPGSTP